MNLFKKDGFQWALKVMVSLGERDLQDGRCRTGKECCSYLRSNYRVKNLLLGHTRALLASYKVAQWSRSAANEELKKHTSHLSSQPPTP